MKIDFTNFIEKVLQKEEKPSNEERIAALEEAISDLAIMLVGGNLDE